MGGRGAFGCFGQPGHRLHSLFALVSGGAYQQVPEDSRAVKDGRYLKKEQITPELLGKVKNLDTIARARGQNLAQMALAWLLKDERVSTVLIGVSKTEQLLDNAKALDNLTFTPEELREIKTILG